MMSLCSRCLQCVRLCRPQDPINLGPRQVLVSLNQFNRHDVGQCFICMKFLCWLESSEPGKAMLRRWEQSSLVVYFCFFARGQEYGGSGEHRQGFLFPSKFAIVPVKEEEEEEDFFEVDLHFSHHSNFEGTMPVKPRHAGFDFGLIKSWIALCSEGHLSCMEKMKRAQFWYPTRLLDLGSSDNDVRLVLTESCPPVGPYLTLSHRWGSQDYQKLERNTERAFQQHINVYDHPQVFREAMAITRALGLRYLWIDALCIKQDDLDDWKSESRKMHDVYSNSYLNISATLAKCGTESLLQPRRLPLPSACLIELEIGGVAESFYIMDDNIWIDEIELAPLNTRGWVFQERYLSPRLLHFGSNQMAWECSEFRTLEIFPMGPPLHPPISGMFPSVHGIDTDSHKFRNMWSNLAHRYSKGELTYNTDKLIAIAGIASSLQAQRSDFDVYFAGMWQSTLIYDLAWSRGYDDVESKPIGDTINRAPSWSWASVDGEITFPILFPQYIIFHFAVVQSFQGEVLDQSGMMQCRGSIYARGFCLPIQLTWQDDPDIVGFSILGFLFLLFDEDDDLDRNHFNLDITVQETYGLEKNDSLLALPLIGSQSKLYGIVIAKTGKPGHYRRVGAFEITLPNTMKDSDGLDPDQYMTFGSLKAPLHRIRANETLPAEISFNDGVASNCLSQLLGDPPSPQTIRID